MAKMTTCLLNGGTIDIDEALGLRESAAHRRIARPEFLCTECGRPVRPHKSGGDAAAHFEHLERNPDCSLSHTPR